VSIQKFTEFSEMHLISGS